MSCCFKSLITAACTIPCLSFASGDSAKITEKDIPAGQKYDSAASVPADYQNIRGLEREERHTSDALRYTVDGILFLPRQLIDGGLYIAGRAGALLDRPEVREKIEDIIYLYKEDLGWHPMFYWTTGYRPKYGLRLFAKTWDHTSYVLGAYHSDDNWRGKVKLVLGPEREFWEWKLEVMGLAEKSDDWEYYGLGADPKNDPRNGIISQSEHTFGNYTQTIQKIQAILEISPVYSWSLSYLTYYHMRKLFLHAYGDPLLKDLFDINMIPAFNSNRPVEQYYQELSLVLDTRETRKKLNPGIRLEGYGGLSQGIGGDKARFYRAGWEASAFIPVIRDNRILILRGLGYWTESTEDNMQIPFTEYPQNLAYRGTPNRAFLRADNRSFTGSIEYQWPAGPWLNAHLFADCLAVGRELDNMGWEHGRYIAGVGADFHYDGKEWGRTEIGYGNEGLRISASLGMPLESNNRGDWN